MDGLLFRKIPLNKYVNLLKYTKLHCSPLTLSFHGLNTSTHLYHSVVGTTGTTSSNTTSSGNVNSSTSGTTSSVSSSKVDSTSNTDTTSGVKDSSTKVDKDNNRELGSELHKDNKDNDKRLSLSQYKSLFLDNKKPYHIASAIAYTNGYPHVGHAYEGIVCDVISRYYKMFGRRVLFSTGTDEHGIKVMNTAKQQQKTPIEICNFYSEEFKKLYKRLLVEYDRFIRTTSKEHILAAKSIWKRVYNKGDIYLGEYNGYYSVREERFIPNTEAKLTDYKDPVSGKPYDLMSESSYFFKMNNYKEPLVKHINDNLDFITPLKCRNEILARLKDPLDDLSISRTSFDWGIQVPDLKNLKETDLKDQKLCGTEYISNRKDNKDDGLNVDDYKSRLDVLENENNVKNGDKREEVRIEEGEWCNGDVNLGYNEDNKLFNESKFYNLTHREHVSKRVNLDPSNGNNTTSTTHFGTSDTGNNNRGTNDSNSGFYGENNNNSGKISSVDSKEKDMKNTYSNNSNSGSSSSDSNSVGRDRDSNISSTSKVDNTSNTTSVCSSSSTSGFGDKNKKDEKHVMYVWFDALSFYMTASGLGESFSEMTNWPTDLQVIGKDISWFQSVILATMCFSMELPLTRKILAHGFIQGPDGRKMSKSLGNVLNLDELLEEVGPESFRYYLLKSTVLGADVNFDTIQLKEMYNSDLADNVGNLVHRLTSLVNKYNGGIVPEYKTKVNYPFDLVELLKESSNMLLKLDLYNLLFLVNQKFKELNNYLTIASPWAEKDENKRNSVLRVMLESVYFLSHLLQPVLPDTMDQLFNKLGTPKRNHMWELSLNLDNLNQGSQVSVGDVLFPKFNTNTSSSGSSNTNTSQNS